MPHGTFLKFIWPSFLAMILFIAFPIISVAVQSFFVEHEQVMVEVENCDPFKCTKVLQVDVAATTQLKEDAPLGRFNGLGTYTNRGHLAFAEVAEIWRNRTSIGEFIVNLYNLPFYKALLFTLTYTAIVTPFVIVLGLLIALGVKRCFRTIWVMIVLLGRRMTARCCWRRRTRPSNGRFWSIKERPMGS